MGPADRRLIRLRGLPGYPAHLLRLDGDGAEAIACDAAMAPIITGDVNVDALEDLVRLCVELDARQRDGARDTVLD